MLSCVTAHSRSYAGPLIGSSLGVARSYVGPSIESISEVGWYCLCNFRSVSLRFHLAGVFDFVRCLCIDVVSGFLLLVVSFVK